MTHILMSVVIAVEELLGISPVPRRRIFLSHITEEKRLAEILKSELEKAFHIDVFVSSDPGSVSPGEKWEAAITQALMDCEAMILLSSPFSISRPWVNFEAGAGWVRGIPVIPLCHTGMKPKDLPLPLGLRQGLEAHTPDDIVKLFDKIALGLGSKYPAPDWNAMAVAVREFEDEYGVLRPLLTHINAILKAVPSMAPLFDTAVGVGSASGQLPTYLVDELRPHLEWMREQRLLNVDNSGGMALVSGGSYSGVVTTLTIESTEALRSILPRAQQLRWE